MFVSLQSVGVRYGVQASNITQVIQMNSSICGATADGLVIWEPGEYRYPLSLKKLNGTKVTALASDGDNYVIGLDNGTVIRRQQLKPHDSDKETVLSMLPGKEIKHIYADHGHIVAIAYVQPKRGNITCYVAFTPSPTRTNPYVMAFKSKSCQARAIMICGRVHIVGAAVTHEGRLHLWNQKVSSTKRSPFDADYPTIEFRKIIDLDIAGRALVTGYDIERKKEVRIVVDIFRVEHLGTYEAPATYKGCLYTPPGSTKLLQFLYGTSKSKSGQTKEHLELITLRYSGEDPIWEREEEEVFRVGGKQATIKSINPGPLGVLFLCTEEFLERDRKAFGAPEKKFPRKMEDRHEYKGGDIWYLLRWKNLDSPEQVKIPGSRNSWIALSQPPQECEECRKLCTAGTWLVNFSSASEDGILYNHIACDNEGLTSNKVLNHCLKKGLKM